MIELWLNESRNLKSKIICCVCKFKLKKILFIFVVLIKSTKNLRKIKIYCERLRQRSIHNILISIIRIVLIEILFIINDVCVFIVTIILILIWVFIRIIAIFIRNVHKLRTIIIIKFVSARLWLIIFCLIIWCIFESLIFWIIRIIFRINWIIFRIRLFVFCSDSNFYFSSNFFFRFQFRKKAIHVDRFHRQRQISSKFQIQIIVNQINLIISEHISRFSCSCDDLCVFDRFFFSFSIVHCISFSCNCCHNRAWKLTKFFQQHSDSFLNFIAQFDKSFLIIFEIKCISS